MAKKIPILDHLSERAKKVSAIISASIAIIGASTGVLGWATSKLTAQVSEQVTALQHSLAIHEAKTEMQITRLELLNLIHNQPSNRFEIEKVAKDYFVRQGGDWYMTGIYSKWAQENGGDVTFITEDI